MARRRRSRRIRRTIGIALVLVGVGLWFGRGWAIGFAGRFLLLDEPVSASDAIVVLGGSLPDRMIHGADLYRKGIAPIIVFGREPANPGIEELRRRGGTLPERDELNRSVALQLGVPESALILVEGRPSSTILEAEYIVPELRRRAVRRVVLVSSKLHTYRASLIFRAVAPEIEFVASATPYDPYDAESWWESRGQVRRVFFEYQKLAVFWLRDRWRTFSDRTDPISVAPGGQPRRAEPSPVRP